MFVVSCILSLLKDRHCQAWNLKNFTLQIQKQIFHGQKNSYLEDIIDNHMDGLPSGAQSQSLCDIPVITFFFFWLKHSNPFVYHTVDVERME